MVHALREVWRAARSAVLDIRPTAESPVVWVRDRAGQETKCGDLHWKCGEAHAHRSANAAVEAVVAEGLFTLAEFRQFDWVDEFDDADDLVGTVADEWEHWSIEEDTSLRLVQTLKRAGRGAAPFIRQTIRAQMLRKIGV